MNYKIAILGSAVDGSDKTVNIAKDLGKALTKYQITLLTGAFEGMPYIVANEFAKSSKEIYGFSATPKKSDQLHLTPQNDMRIYSKIMYIPETIEKEFDLRARRKFRNVYLTSSCDAGIIVSGRWGTLNEFTCLHDMGKVIGILTGTGGVADEIPSLMKKISKKSNAIVCVGSNPKELVSKVMTELQKRFS